MTADEIRRLALEMPGASESSHMGHPDFRIGGRAAARSLIHLNASATQSAISSGPTTEDTMRKFVIAAALAMAGLVASAGAQQPAAPQGPEYRPGYGFGTGAYDAGVGQWGRWLTGWWSGSDAQLCSGMVSRVEGRLTRLKAELKITAAQEPLWAAYASTARDNAQMLSGLCTATFGERSEAMSLPERLDLREQLMVARLEAMRASDKVLKPLYAALDDGQKRVADHLFSTPIGRAGVMGMMM